MYDREYDDLGPNDFEAMFSEPDDSERIFSRECDDSVYDPVDLEPDDYVDDHDYGPEMAGGACERRSLPDDEDPFEPQRPVSDNSPPSEAVTLAERLPEVDIDAPQAPEHGSGFEIEDDVVDHRESNRNPPVDSVSQRKRIPASLDATEPIGRDGPEVPDPQPSSIEIPMRESLYRRIRRWLVGTK